MKVPIRLAVKPSILLVTPSRGAHQAWGSPGSEKNRLPSRPSGIQKAKLLSQAMVLADELGRARWSPTASSARQLYRTRGQASGSP